jgi:hypothetical protein
MFHDRVDSQNTRRKYETNYSTKDALGTGRDNILSCHSAVGLGMGVFAGALTAGAQAICKYIYIYNIYIYIYVYIYIYIYTCVISDYLHDRQMTLVKAIVYIQPARRPGEAPVAQQPVHLGGRAPHR